jgi:two-component system response regulator ChvI
MDSTHSLTKTKKRQQNKETILIIDDEFGIVDSVKIWLERYDFAVYGFTDPLQALEYFKHNSGTITLVLSDIRMPRMNGYELVTKIKELQPKVKIILMSAFEINKEEFSRMLPSVETGLISKPISMKNLVKYIENITKQKGL